MTAPNARAPVIPATEAPETNHITSGRIIADNSPADKRLRTAVAELALAGIEVRKISPGVFWLLHADGRTVTVIAGLDELVRRAPQYLDARREALRVLGREVRP